MIILDLKYKDLYSSWEESLFEKIDDYKNIQVPSKLFLLIKIFTK